MFRLCRARAGSADNRFKSVNQFQGKPPPDWRYNPLTLGLLFHNTEFSEGTSLSRTTFNRHRTAVEEIFGIVIGCYADNKYHIVDRDLLRSDSVHL